MVSNGIASDSEAEGREKAVSELVLMGSVKSVDGGLVGLGGFLVLEKGEEAACGGKAGLGLIWGEGVHGGTAVRKNVKTACLN